MAQEPKKKAAPPAPAPATPAAKAAPAVTAAKVSAAAPAAKGAAAASAAKPPAAAPAAKATAAATPAKGAAAAPAAPVEPAGIGPGTFGEVPETPPQAERKPIGQILKEMRLVTEQLRKALHKGANTIAVHTHQTIGGQYIDLALLLE